MSFSSRSNSARWGISCLALVIFLALVVAAVLAGLVILNPRQWLAAAASGSGATPTLLPDAASTGTAIAVAHIPTDVPTVTLAPTSTNTPTATPTPTSTPTNTSTSTPVPPTATFTATPIPPTKTRIPATSTPKPPPTSAAKRCVSVVGDSVAHGDAVYEIPGVGFLQAQLAPVSSFIDYQYKQRGVGNMQVLNRSSSAVGISSSNHPSYMGTYEYSQLLQDGCQYTVIIPWINDLSSGQDAGAAAPNHVAALANLVQQVIRKNPNGKVLVVNYYTGAAAPFAGTSFATGFNSGTVAAFNAQIGAACSGGSLVLPQVKCIDANTALGGMGQAALVGNATQQEIQSMMTAQPNPDQANQLNYYFSQHPGGSITGDGVHLSNSGKAQLAAYLVGQMP